MKHDEHLSMLPEHMREGMKNYIEKGIEPGTFLRLMLEHRIYEAASHADDRNKDYLFKYIYFMYNFMPSQAHGSVEYVRDWIKSGGYIGGNATPPGRMYKRGDEDNIPF